MKPAGGAAGARVDLELPRLTALHGIHVHLEDVRLVPGARKHIAHAVVDEILHVAADRACGRRIQVGPAEIDDAAGVIALRVQYREWHGGRLEGVKDYAIFMLDTEGRITCWNAGAVHITGYREYEFLV